MKRVLVLTGGGSKLKGLDQFMAEELEVEVEILAGLTKFEFEAEQLSFHLLKEQLPYLSVSIAAAMRRC